MRRLWPKYDKDLNQQVDTMDLIKKFIEHIFQEADLISDFKVLRLRQSLDDIIYREGGFLNLNSQDKILANKELHLNQKQIVNVLKKFYGLVSNASNMNSPIRKSNVSVRNSSSKLGRNSQSGFNNTERMSSLGLQNDWADFYMRVKEVS